MKKILMTLMSVAWMLNGNAETPDSPSDKDGALRDGKKFSLSDQNPSLNQNSHHTEKNSPTSPSPLYMQYMQNLNKEVLKGAELENELDIENVVKRKIAMAENIKEIAQEIADKGLYPWKRALLLKDLQLQKQMYDTDDQLKDKQCEIDDRQEQLQNKQSFVEGRALTAMEQEEIKKEIEKLEKEKKELEKLYAEIVEKVKKVEKKLLLVEKGLKETIKYYSNQEEEEFAHSIIKKMEAMSPVVRMLKAMTASLSGENKSMMNPWMESMKSGDTDHMLYSQTPNQNAHDSTRSISSASGRR